MSLIKNAFSAEVYAARRKVLREKFSSGLILFLGHDQAAMNYAANPYPFRQDSSFLYYWGLDLPGHAGIMDIDAGWDALVGGKPGPDEVIWTGHRDSLEDLALGCGGANELFTWDVLDLFLKKALARGRRVHFPPQCRSMNMLKIDRLLGLHYSLVNYYSSRDLTRAVVAQRSIKAPAEIEMIEQALEVARDMHLLAMKSARPGLLEKEVVGRMNGLAMSRGGRPAFPPVFSMDGHILHNPHYDNVLEDGRLVINDSGVELASHYASDITRTFPVGGRFTTKQKEVYSLVLKARDLAVESIAPGVEYREVHTKVEQCLAQGLVSLGLLKGDPLEAWEANAQALFFPHGLGHMMGLDVHDMEVLGENYVGYTDSIKRSDRFGASALRLARKLEPGFVLTVEPGLYFIPALIDRWQAEKQAVDFINYDRVDQYRDFGGVRIEDDVVVTNDGCRVLGPPIPRSVREVEEASF